MMFSSSAHASSCSIVRSSLEHQHPSFMPRRMMPTKLSSKTQHFCKAPKEDTTPKKKTQKSRRAHLKTTMTMLLSSLFVSNNGGGFTGKKSPRWHAFALEANEQLESSEFVQNLVDKSEAKRDERRRERLDAYSKKNFKEYLQFVEHGRTPKTENEKKIRAWLETNAE